MEFPFYVSKLLQLDEKGIGVIDGRHLPSQFGSFLSSSNFRKDSSGSSKSQMENLGRVIDALGERSAKVKCHPELH